MAGKYALTGRHYAPGRGRRLRLHLVLGKAAGIVQDPAGIAGRRFAFALPALDGGGALWVEWVHVMVALPLK